MGLIKAATGAAGGTLADQWKEFFFPRTINVSLSKNSSTAIH